MDVNNYPPKVKMPDALAFEAAKKVRALAVSGKTTPEISVELGISKSRVNYLRFARKFGEPIKVGKRSTIKHSKKFISVLGADEPTRSYKDSAFMTGFHLGRYAEKNGLSLADLTSMLSEKEK